MAPQLELVAADGAGQCDTCGETWPYLLHLMSRDQECRLASVCIYCAGYAIQNATGWKIGDTVARYTIMREAGEIARSKMKERQREALVKARHSLNGRGRRGKFIPPNSLARTGISGQPEGSDGGID